MDFCEELSTAIQNSGLKSNAETFILGDMNINYLNSKNPECKELKANLTSLGFKQLIKEPTRPGVKGTCLDLIFTN